MARKVEKTDAEWKEILNPAQFAVCRGKGTEPAFSGKYAHSKDPGVYQCSCCGADLFGSETKYESGTGWPSFWQPLEAENVEIEEDRSWGMVRTEVTCSSCGAHLGHVFEDGPEPTGLRYCMNSVSLNLVPKDGKD